LFVYGSLLAGEANHHVLRGALFAGLARTIPAYTLFDLGPFPALLAEGDTSVHGALYVIEPPLLAHVDAFEDHPRSYRRSPIELAEPRDASLAGGVETYLYVDAADARRCPIVGESWPGYLARRRAR
jgi:gamma-glutamylcyclotransferase (GGCT)/AIG2-like uncharacterized protein YtfP